jgi:hypothetical protein
MSLHKFKIQTMHACHCTIANYYAAAILGFRDATKYDPGNPIARDG